MLRPNTVLSPIRMVPSWQRSRCRRRGAPSGRAPAGRSRAAPAISTRRPRKTRPVGDDVRIGQPEPEESPVPQQVPRRPGPVRITQRSEASGQEPGRAGGPVAAGAGPPATCQPRTHQPAESSRAGDQLEHLGRPLAQRQRAGRLQLGRRAVAPQRAGAADAVRGRAEHVMAAVTDHQHAGRPGRRAGAAPRRPPAPWNRAGRRRCPRRRTAKYSARPRCSTIRLECGSGLLVATASPDPACRAGSKPAPSPRHSGEVLKHRSSIDVVPAVAGHHRVQPGARRPAAAASARTAGRAGCGRSPRRPRARRSRRRPARSAPRMPGAESLSVPSRSKRITRYGHRAHAGLVPVISTL